MLSFLSKHPENSILYPNNLQLSQWRWVFHHRLGVQNQPQWLFTMGNQAGIPSYKARHQPTAWKNPVPLTSDQLCWKTLMLTNSKTDDQCYTIINNISYTIINSRFLDPHQLWAPYWRDHQGLSQGPVVKAELTEIRKSRLDSIPWSNGAVWTGRWGCAMRDDLFSGDENNSTTTV